jgi:membrane associated rhomboid family serine protease
MNELPVWTTNPGATLLLAAMVIASLIGLFAAPSMVERNLFRPHWLLPQRQYLTLITSGFLHADLAHLFFNGFTFWAFAFPLERAIGTPRFLALYFFGLFASDLGTWFTGTTPSTAASARRARSWRCCSRRSSTSRRRRSSSCRSRCRCRRRCSRSRTWPTATTRHARRRAA